jgi:hypothetical protein
MRRLDHRQGIAASGRNCRRKKRREEEVMRRDISRSARVIAALLIAASAHISEGKNWKIKVGPKACDLTDEQTGAAVQKHSISKRYKETTHWDSHQRGRHVYLVFHVARDCGPPFANLIPKGTGPHGEALYQLGDTTTDQLDAGAILEGFKCYCPPNTQCDLVDPNNPKPWQIKYDQYLEDANGTFKKCDGWIIVKP